MARIRDPREIAERMVKGFTSDVAAFAFDRDLVDYETVRRLIAVAGVEGYLNKFTSGNLVVYSIKRQLVEARCKQLRCRNVPREKLRACIAKCFHETMREVSETVARSIRDAASMLEA